MTETVSQMFHSMPQIRPQSLDWAWDGLIPMGKLTLLTGDPGVGKSLVALQVASMVTRGVTSVMTKGENTNRGPSQKGLVSQCARMPVPVCGGMKTKTKGGQTPGTESVPLSKRGVLIFSGVDQLEDTVMPRLVAAGADPSQVFLFKGHMVDELIDDAMPKGTTSKRRQFLLSRDMTHLDWCLEELCEHGVDVGLIVIDSIDQYIGTNEKKSDRIEVVAKLADLAARSGAAVLVTANTSMKAGSRGGTVVYQELLNTARSVLMVAENPEQPDQRLVLPVKHNLTRRPPGFSFSIEQGVIQWGTEPLPYSAADFLAQNRGNSKSHLPGNDAHEIDRASRWLEEELQGGQVSSEEIQRRATQVDISYGTLRRASKILGCKVRKQNNRWFWSLPEVMEDENGAVATGTGFPTRRDASLSSRPELETAVA